MEIVTHVVTADTTNKDVLNSLGMRNFDHVIVAIGDDIQSSILTTLSLKELGVKQVSAKAINDYHGIILDKIGADRVIHPERDSGERMAMSIMSPNVLDYLELPDEYGILEVTVGGKVSGKTLSDLDVQAKFGINIVAVKTSRNEFSIAPKTNEQLNKDDILVIMGTETDIQRFRAEMLDNG